MTDNMTYSKSGVDYKVMDVLKRLAQKAGKNTAINLTTHNLKEIDASRGESAYVIESDDCYFAFVQEGLGTKNLIADQMSIITGKSYYDLIAQDTVAMIVNDLITVGAKPVTVLAYWAPGSSEWFNNKKRMEDLVSGWKSACDLSGVSWGGGETPTLSGIIEKNTIDLAGSAFGIIKPKSRLVLGNKLQAGDVIVAFESSGIHSNGISLARKIAEKLSDGYTTKLSSGQTYGEALLIPTTIYAKLVNDLLDNEVDIHYMANITGHGWRKIMRATQPFTYRITSLPPTPEIFTFIAEKGPVTTEEMYANFNMGAGFVIFVPQSLVAKVQKISSNRNIKTYEIGRVESGEKQVIIEPNKITYKAESLQLKAS